MSDSLALKLAIEFNIIKQDAIILLKSAAERKLIALDELLLFEKILHQKAIQKINFIKKDLLTPEKEIVRGFFDFSELERFLNKIKIENDQVEKERLLQEKSIKEKTEKVEQIQLTEEKTEIVKNEQLPDNTLIDNNKPLNYPDVFENIGNCNLITVLGHGATIKFI